jgi:tRNA(fMet)-specific endonuclease VapC
MYLLHTNHCSRIIFWDSDVVDRAAQVGENNLFTCTIVQGELFYMVEKSQRRSENLATLEGFLQDLSVYGVDEQIAQIYGQLKRSIAHQVKLDRLRLNCPQGYGRFATNLVTVAAIVNE